MDLLVRLFALLLAYCGSNPLSPRPAVLPQRLAGLLAERIDPDEAQQPGVLFEQADGQLRLCITHVQQVCPQVREHAHHPRHHGLGIGGALQVTISTVDDLGPDQCVSDVLRAAEADLDQVTPAAAHPPQADPGPVTSERPLPLAGDELLPPEDFHLFRVVVIHRPNGTASRPLLHVG